MSTDKRIRELKKRWGFIRNNPYVQQMINKAKEEGKKFTFRDAKNFLKKLNPSNKIKTLNIYKKYEWIRAIQLFIEEIKLNIKNNQEKIEYNKEQISNLKKEKEKKEKKEKNIPNIENKKILNCIHNLETNIHLLSSEIFSYNERQYHLNNATTNLLSIQKELVITEEKLNKLKEEENKRIEEENREHTIWNENMETLKNENIEYNKIKEKLKNEHSTLSREITIFFTDVKKISNLSEIENKESFNNLLTYYKAKFAKK